MTTLSDVLKGIRDVVVLNDRLAQLAQKVDRLEMGQRDQLERLVRVESFVDFVRPAILRRALPQAKD
ncbi:MAG TPA: hypothetical protein VGH81_12680 [Rudaea sp.]|jgi:hypothetical protein